MKDTNWKRSTKKKPVPYGRHPFIREGGKHEGDGRSAKARSKGEGASWLHLQATKLDRHNDQGFLEIDKGGYVELEALTKPQMG
jgi:hypothetical protein